MKVFSIFSIILLTGLATTFAAPVEDGNASLKGYITAFLRQIGLMEDDPCLNYECYNGGNCLVLPTKEPECICDDGFAGEHCQFVDYCHDRNDPKTCNGNGICQNDNSEDGYSCYCAPGFTGKDCDTVDVCYPNPCEHGGICSPDEEGTDGRMCDCPEGYYGPTCHIEDACRVHPCKNGGTCSTDEEFEKNCDCPPNWMGSDCEIKVVCDPMCEHGGICALDRYNNTACYCPPGFFGMHCENSVCEPNPCFNGGSCNV